MNSTLSIYKPLARKSSRGRGKAPFAISAPLENALLGGVEALDPASPRPQQSLPADVRFPPTTILPWSQPLAIGHRKSPKPLERVPSFVPTHPFATARQLPSPAPSHSRSASLPESPQVEHQFGIALGGPGRLSVPPSPTSPEPAEPRRRRRPSTRRIGQNGAVLDGGGANPAPATSEGGEGRLLAVEAPRAPWSSGADGGRASPTTSVVHSSSEPPYSTYRTTSRNSPLPFAHLLTSTTATSSASPIAPATPSENLSLSASIAAPIKYGVGSDLPQHSGGDSKHEKEKRKAASKQAKLGSGKGAGAPSVVEHQEILHELPEVATLLAGGPRFSVGTLLNDFLELAKADELETLQHQYNQARPSLPSESTPSATSSELIGTIASQAATDPPPDPNPPPPAKSGFFSRFKRTKRTLNTLPTPPPDVATGTALASPPADARPSDASSTHTRSSRLRKPKRPTNGNPGTGIPERQRTKSVTTSPEHARSPGSGAHLRRTSSLPPVPTPPRASFPPIDSYPVESSSVAPPQILDLPVERRVRAERVLWKEREGNQTKAARVTDWLRKVGPVQNAPPPSPLVDGEPQARHQRSSSREEPVAAYPLPKAGLFPPSSKRRSSIDFVPPRPAFFQHSSPASSLPVSPDGTPTVTKRGGRFLNETSDSFDMPRTPTEVYIYSSSGARDRPSHFPTSPIRPFARSNGFASTPTPPPSSPFPLRHFPPPPPKKPSRNQLHHNHRDSGGSIDSLMDPRSPHLDPPAPPSTASSRYSDLVAPPPIKVDSGASRPNPESLSTSQDSAFTLSSVGDDTLFFVPPKPPRGHLPSRPAPALAHHHIQQRKIRSKPPPLVGRIDIVTQGVAQVGVRRTGSLVKTSSLSRKGSTRSTADSLIDPALGSVEGSVVGGTIGGSGNRFLHAG